MKLSPDFSKLIRHIVSGNIDAVSDMLSADPSLATEAAEIGAARENAEEFFFTEIRHYLYGGDTALHIAAAGFRCQIAMLLVANGANIGAKNRRGQQPLHYAADANLWNPDAQAETINYLLSAGADANALDKSGVAPLHRAVRTRSAAAVLALIDGGADPSAPNEKGSTPLRLAELTTGRSGSGSDLARQQQAIIIELLSKYDLP